MSNFINGFLIELALIMAVGLQNAFILRQGIRKEHTLVAIVICTLAESSLIAIGVAGMGVVLTSRPQLIKIITILGAAFLTYYAIKSLYMAVKSTETLDVDKLDSKKRSAIAVIFTALAFALLNPHVLIDTTLMGALSTKYYPHAWQFAFGAMVAAFLWYSLLGILGTILAKPLNKPITWKIINLMIAILCAYMAYTFSVGDNEHFDDFGVGEKSYNEEVIK